MCTDNASCALSHVVWRHKTSHVPQNSAGHDSFYDGILRDMTRFMTTSYVESYVMRHVCIDTASYVSSHVTYDMQISARHDSFLLNSVTWFVFMQQGPATWWFHVGWNLFFLDKETWTMSHVWMRHVDWVVCVRCNASCVPILHMYCVLW